VVDTIPFDLPKTDTPHWSRFGRKSPKSFFPNLNLPGRSGFELLSLARDRFPSIRLIAMSGASLQQMIL
jgi:hypothetical protein